MVFAHIHTWQREDILAACHANAMLTSRLAMIKNVICMTALLAISPVLDKAGCVGTTLVPALLIHMLRNATLL